jgi:hypothetical protein
MQTKKTVNLIDIVSPELVEFVAMVSLGIIDFNALGSHLIVETSSCS